MKSSLAGSLFCLACLTGLPAFAALPSEFSIKFYRSPKSLFASGEANRNELDKNKTREFFEYSLLVERQNKRFWAPADLLARDLSLSAVVVSLKDEEKYKVIEAKESWVLGERVSDGGMIWHPIQDLIPSQDDLGMAMTLIPIPLKTEPNSKSATKFRPQARSLWQILEYQDGWVLLQDPKNPSVWGFTETDNILLKHDFASFVMTASKKWIPVQYRQGSEMVTARGGTISLKKIKAIMTKPDLAISTVIQDQPSLLLRQSFTIKKWAADTWAVSKVKGHGEIFWKKSSSEAKASDPNNEGILIEDLLKKEIFSVSFHPNSSQYGIVSAHGIYMTRDGLHWQKLAQFQDQNLPVLLSGKGTIYVGDQRSTDKGKTFTPYFKWEQIAALISDHQKSEPRILKVTALESISSNLMRVIIDTGTRKISLAGNTQEDSIKKWELY